MIRHTARIRFARRIAVAACIVAYCASGAFAARREAEPRAADGAAGNSATQPQKKPKLKPKVSPPPRKIRRKAKAARKPDVFYRWSAEQLMLGGVDPSQIGRAADDANGKSEKQSAASDK